MGYTLMQCTDLSKYKCVTVILTNMLKLEKTITYQCIVTLFVTVSLFCYWVAVIFVCLRDLWIILISANFSVKTLVYNII